MLDFEMIKKRVINKKKNFFTYVQELLYLPTASFSPIYPTYLY